jgi:hypothetical protein
MQAIGISTIVGSPHANPLVQHGLPPTPHVRQTPGPIGSVHASPSDASHRPPGAPTGQQGSPDAEPQLAQRPITHESPSAHDAVVMPDPVVPVQQICMLRPHGSQSMLPRLHARPASVHEPPVQQGWPSEPQRVHRPSTQV